MAPYVDITDTGDGRIPIQPGVYPATVAGSEIKTSHSGNDYIQVKLIHTASGDPICWDRIMLSGGFKRVGRERLISFGYAPDFKGQIEPSDLVGKSCWVAVKPEEYDGKTRLKIAPSRGPFSGSWHVDSPPPESMRTVLATPETGDDTPF